MNLIESFEQEVKNDLESFKKVWRRVTKQDKGDVVRWDNEEFQVEDVREVPKELKDRAEPGEKLYTICRFEPVAGMKLKVLCHRITAQPGELK